MRTTIETKKEVQERQKAELLDRKEEINRMMQHGEVLIKEKSRIIHGLKTTIQQTQNHQSKVMEMKQMGQREAEFHAKQDMHERSEKYKQEIKNIKEQYEHIIQQEESKLKKFQEEADGYTISKKQRIREARQECADLYVLAKQQEKTIKDIENGVFSGGIKSFNIPSNHKPQVPERQHYPFVFKSLEKTKTSMNFNP